MGFWKAVAYFFAILGLLGGLATLFSAQYVTHQMVGIMLSVSGIFSIFLIRIIGSLDSMQSDLRFLANREKKVYEPENEIQPHDADDKDNEDKE